MLLTKIELISVVNYIEQEQRSRTAISFKVLQELIANQLDEEIKRLLHAQGARGTYKALGENLSKNLI